MRTRPAAFRTDASKNVTNAEFTSDLLYIDGVPLYVNEELRANTNSDLKRDKAVMMSTTPSAKYNRPAIPIGAAGESAKNE